MPTEIRCPKCASGNVRFSKKHSRYDCEDCSHEFVPEKPFVSKRVFISYGHDEHTSLADRLNRDLKARGHQTWFDKERLKPGQDWAACIEEGMDWLAEDRANSFVILLLTPHAVRRPDGFCLREIHRAQAPNRRIEIIPLMVVESEPPIEICHLLWLDLQECIPISKKEELYAPKFVRLLDAIEKGDIRFQGPQQRLKNVLQPLEFDADTAPHLARFTGRQWARSTSRRAAA